MGRKEGACYGNLYNQDPLEGVIRRLDPSGCFYSVSVGRTDSGYRSGILPSARPQETAPLDYLQSLGWDVSGEPVCDQVLMPDSFSDAYSGFLAIQEKGGFDLTACAGQTVTRYTFTLNNYPTGEQGILADVMVLDGRIVGGEIRSPKLDGFMRALVARDQIT
jgi:hypothetical protein